MEQQVTCPRSASLSSKLIFVECRNEWRTMWWWLWWCLEGDDNEVDDDNDDHITFAIQYSFRLRPMSDTQHSWATLSHNFVAWQSFCLTWQVAQVLTRRATIFFWIETISILRQFHALSLSCDWSIIYLNVNCCPWISLTLSNIHHWSGASDKSLRRLTKHYGTDMSSM